jgi:inositol oxygenase
LNKRVREDDYHYLMNEQDKAMFKWVKYFNQYDLYSKSSKPKDEAALMPFYKQLIEEYFPGTLRW